MKMHRLLLSLAIGAGLSAQTAKVFQYSDHDVVRINAKLRFTTMIVLPKTEQILDFICGDKEFWVVNGSQNFALIKPAKAGTQTNVNLITASGAVYSFLVTEVEKGEPDLKVFIEPKDTALLSASRETGPRFVDAKQIEDYRHQVEIAKAAERKAEAEAAAAKQEYATKFSLEASSYRARYPAELKFPYRFEANKQPFLVSAIWNDGKFTYIQSAARETPALYEVKDGKPNLINFQFQAGTYVADKVLSRGYLAIGNKRLNFESAEN